MIHKRFLNALFWLFFANTFQLLAQRPGSSLCLYLGMETAGIAEPVTFRQQGVLQGLSVRELLEARPVLAVSYVRTLKTGAYFELGFRYDGPVDGNKKFIPVNDLLPIQGVPTLFYSNRTTQIHLEAGLDLGIRSGKFQSRLGSFIRYSDSRFDFDSRDTLFFGQERRFNGLQFGLTPHFSLPLGKRFDLDMSIPVQLLQAGFEYTRIENPALTPSQQKNRLASLEAFKPLAQFRFGLVWHLNKPDEK
jgi:hypothetical protein